MLPHYRHLPPATRSPKPIRATPRALVRAISLVIACALAPYGCAEKAIENGPLYPDNLKQARVLDVQVLRDGTEISMTNTAGEALPAGRLWINAWYSRDFPGLAVGESATYSLHDFKDRYGDAFRAGGFFATQRPDRMVQAQIESGDQLIGLIAIRASVD